MGELRVAARAGGHAVVGESSLETFRGTLRGPLLLAGDAGYDEARTVFNALIDHRPALIARCSGAADVIAAVKFAREHDLLVSIKGGGHGVAGMAVCDGGLMIDPSRMNSIRVDPGAHIVRAEPGVLGAELDRETQAFGLATPVGTVSTTGIAGLTLGGGQSWLGSKFGFAIDNLLSVDIVTADGKLRTASAAQNEDLFWGIRGPGTISVWRPLSSIACTGLTRCWAVWSCTPLIRWQRSCAFTANSRPPNPTICRPGPAS